jgi:hypothetical protein
MMWMIVGTLVDGCGGGGGWGREGEGWLEST